MSRPTDEWIESEQRRREVDALESIARALETVAPGTFATLSIVLPTNFGEGETRRVLIELLREQERIRRAGDGR